MRVTCVSPFVFALTGWWLWSSATLDYIGNEAPPGESGCGRGRRVDVQRQCGLVQTRALLTFFVVGMLLDVCCGLDMICQTGTPVTV